MQTPTTLPDPAATAKKVIAHLQTTEPKMGSSICGSLSKVRSGRSHLSTCSSWASMQKAACVDSQQDAARGQHSGSDDVQQHAPGWLQGCVGRCVQHLTSKFTCQDRSISTQSTALQQLMTEHTCETLAHHVPAQTSLPHKGSKAAAEVCQIAAHAHTQQPCWNISPASIRG